MKLEKPMHPGEVLQKEFFEPMGLSQNRLSMALHVSARRINEIVLGKRAITADTALRLAKGLGRTPQYWMGLFRWNMSWRKRRRLLASVWSGK